MVIALHNGMTLESMVAPGEVGIEELADAPSVFVRAMFDADARP
jgi:hypothetical protein